jgi:excisionase family DNA binding protein
MNQTVTPRLYNVKEAALYLGIGHKAVRELITQGRLPYVQRKPGNSPFLIDRLDLDRWIEANKNPATQL